MADIDGARDTRPSQSNFFHFHAVLNENMPNERLVLPPADGALHMGNPGTATYSYELFPNFDNFSGTKAKLRRKDHKRSK